jgi:hypothetical protein
VDCKPRPAPQSPSSSPSRTRARLMRAFPHQKKNPGAIRVAAGAIHPIRDHPGGSSEDEHNAENELVPKDRAAARTLDALVFALRKGGIALENPSNRRRLARAKRAATSRGLHASSLVASRSCTRRRRCGGWSISSLPTSWPRTRIGSRSPGPAESKGSSTCSWRRAAELKGRRPYRAALP